nr:hypothetical protein CFP56_25904 [Quercus suber]
MRGYLGHWCWSFSGLCSIGRKMGLPSIPANGALRVERAQCEAMRVVGLADNNDRKLYLDTVIAAPEDEKELREGARLAKLGKPESSKHRLASAVDSAEPEFHSRTPARMGFTPINGISPREMSDNHFETTDPNGEGGGAPNQPAPPDHSTKRTVTAAKRSKGQRENTLELLSNLQKMSKANSQVFAIIAKARELKRKYREQVAAKRKSPGPAVISPPASCEPSLTSPDVTLEIPDSDPVAVTTNSSDNRPKRVVVDCSPTPEPPDPAARHLSKNKDSDPFRWSLDVEKLQNSDNAASEIYRLKLKGEGETARIRRDLKELALIMNWEVLKD